MIRITPDALYTAAEISAKLGWCSRTVRRAARRIGKKPRCKFFTSDEFKRMAVGR